MYINKIFEMSMILDNVKFQKVLKRAYKKVNLLEEGEGEYIDHSLVHKGITVIYRDSQYKKKIKLIIDSRLVLDDKSSDLNRFIRKLDKRIHEYFDFQYNINDFILSMATFTTDIDVNSRENVSAYLKVLRRIGRVKGFLQSGYDCFEDVDSFCLEGNSSFISFWIYDLEGFIENQLGEKEIDKKKLKSMIRESQSILRAEVRLMKPKAIRAYTDASDVTNQIVILLQKCQDIFFDVFTQIIPYGDYYKKDKAVDIVRKKIKDDILRRKMLRLIALIPEKKSLYLAGKAMNCRNIEKVMEGFAKINVSPVTISKRHDAKNLKNIYEYLFQ